MTALGSFLKNAVLGGGALLTLSFCSSPTASSSQQAASGAAATYTNPVYAAQFPDPFVLQHEGNYYAFGTSGDSRTADGRIFTLLTSPDLVKWTPAGGALTPPPGAEGAQFWAPEVVLHEGTFYMYYSMGGGAIGAEVGHQLRVATSKTPQGPYTQVATMPVPGSKFTIDAHPYQDTDGQWYLFYAKDFTDTNEGYRPGTGLVVDKLVGMTKLANQPRTVMRARHDWTLFEAKRKMPLYDNRTFPEWHTLEGPFVRRHAGKYYCFYSGSNFLTAGYGVDYCVADRIMGPYREDRAPADTAAAGGARVLHSVAGKVRGPGHHSHTMGPDGRTEYLVYHAWNEGMTERQLCIDRLNWTAQGPRAAGPTYTAQPAPAK